MKQKNIVIASDSFKGTLSSLEICNLFKEYLKNKEDIIPTYIPIADGGEGSLEALSYAVSGHFEKIEVLDLYFHKKEVSFYVDDNKNAYIEAASCVGLNLATKDNNPGLVTTYGLGEQIFKAIELGYKTIYMFLGGSASNDGGAGLASALSVKFYKEDGSTFIPTGLTLKDIVKIDNSEALKIIKDVEIVVLSDVLSPFYGLEGAAYKFAPQKGAKPKEVIKLDDGLRHLSSVIQRDLNIDVANVPGAGAAGGLGGGLVGLLNATIKSGIDTLLDLVSFDEKIKNADLVVSGEGKTDRQTFDGKVIDGVAKRCMKMDKPLSLIVGVSEISLNELRNHYPCIKDLFETNEKHLPFESIKASAKKDYLKQIDKLF